MNAVCKYTFGKTYNQIYLDSLNGGLPVPKDGDHHVLVCPSAPSAAGTTGGDSDTVTPDGYFTMYGYIHNGGALTLNKADVCLLCDELQALGIDQHFTGKITQIQHSSETVLVFEKRTSISEVTAADDAYFVSVGGRQEVC